MNRFVEGSGIELDPAYVKLAAERLADRGYLPMIEMLKRWRKNGRASDMAYGSGER